MKYIKQLLGQNDLGLELLNYNSGEEHFGLDSNMVMKKLESTMRCEVLE